MKGLRTSEGLRTSAFGALGVAVAVAVLGCGGGEQPGGKSQPQGAPERKEPPSVQVEITSPDDGDTVRAPSVVIRGTVTPGAVVELNGHRAKVRGRRFSRAMKLRDLGSNSFEIEAQKDGYADADSVTLEVIRKRSAAEIAAARERRRQRELAAEQRRAEEIAAATKTFSGNGSKNIGSITVDEESILEWTNVGDPEFRQMLIYDRGFGISVSSEAESGDTVVPPGTYRNITVAGNSWTIKIRPRD
jgi:hypothetical protein